MKSVGWRRGVLVAIAVLGWAGSGRPARAPSPPAATFPIALVDNRVFVGVEVEGAGPFQFLLDTGSPGVAIDEALRVRLGLGPIGAGTSGGAGEGVAAYSTVHLKAVDLGKVSLGAMDVPSFDNQGLSRAVGFQRFDGVLGADIFERNVVTIDTARARLTVEDAGRFRAAKGVIGVPIGFNDNRMPTVLGSVNGIAARFEVDTGDRSSLTLFGPFWRTHRLDRAIGPTVSAMTGYGVGGPIRGLVGRPADFSLGRVRVPAPVTRLSLQKAGAFTRADYAGSIGMGILKRFVVSFDYPHRMMWLAAGGDFAAPDRYDRSGAWLGLAGGDRLEILSLVEGGPAARVGLRRGDVLAWVDGVAANASALFRLRALLSRPDVARVDFHITRDGAPMTVQVALQDLISAPK